MYQFPVALLSAAGRQIVYGPVAFVYGAGNAAVHHPSAVWSAWTAEDWAAKCPDLRVLSVIDTPPKPAVDERFERLPEDQWEEGGGAVRVAYLRTALSPTEIAAQEAARLTAARADKVAAINAERDRRLSAGAPYASQRIEVSDKGRADLGGMATAAILTISGAAPWSEGYARGWIAVNNERVPLPSPAAGIALAAAVGDWYGRTIQHARDLKDAVLASDDPAAIDIGGGWPS